MSKTVQDGDAVQVHYTGRLGDGSIFDSSRGGEPLSFVVGNDEVIAGFDDAVRGLQLGQSRTVDIAPDQAYGPVQEELIAKVARTDLPSDLDLTIGSQYEVTQEDGEPFMVTVTAIEDGIVTLDANHPLAGQALTFDIELVAVG